MKISVAIPTWSMNGKGSTFLDRSLKQLAKQSHEPFEVVVTDHSVDDEICYSCKKYEDLLNIRYYRNERLRGNPAANTNTGISMCTGDYIKLLCHDDFLYDSMSLYHINEALEKTSAQWLVSSYVHQKDSGLPYRYHEPSLNENISTVNTIGTPSCLTIKNADVLFFDEALSYMYDCEYYHRMIKKFGEPHILKRVTMVNRIHGDQTTNMVSKELAEKEEAYIHAKHS